LPPSGVNWRTAMRQRALSARDVLIRHPWATTMLESRSNPGPATLRHHDAVLGSLRQAGFSLAMAGHAFSAINSYIYGFAMQQINLPFHGPDEVAEMAESFLQQFPTDAYPHLAAFTVEHVMQPGYDYANEFEFGLDLILDGLERLRGEPGTQ